LTSVGQLLFYRTLCDVGIGLRFLVSAFFNYYVCGSHNCVPSRAYETIHLSRLNFFIDYSKEGEDGCQLSAFVLEFFVIASECWMVCIASDLAVCLTNPFSSIKKRLVTFLSLHPTLAQTLLYLDSTRTHTHSPLSLLYSCYHIHLCIICSRMIYYHIFSWGTAFAFALALATHENIYGYWYPNVELKPSLCWVDADSDGEDVTHSKLFVNYRPFVFVYIPFILMYAYVIYVAMAARKLLNNGLSKSLLHRAGALWVNRVMIVIFMSYWFFQWFLYIFADQILDPYETPSQILWSLFVFGLGGKGTACLLVYIIAYLDISQADNTEKHPPSSDNQPSGLHTNQSGSSAGGISLLEAGLGERVESGSDGEEKREESKQQQDEEEEDEGGGEIEIDMFALNISLQEQVLEYATDGIRKCATVKEDAINDKKFSTFPLKVLPAYQIKRLKVEEVAEKLSPANISTKIVESVIGLPHPRRNTITQASIDAKPSEDSLESRPSQTPSLSKPEDIELVDQADRMPSMTEPLPPPMGDFLLPLVTSDDGRVRYSYPITNIIGKGFFLRDRVVCNSTIFF
jgi:hypothetical protein